MPLVQNISFSQLNVAARWTDLPAGTLIQSALMNPAIGASPIVGMVCNIDEGMHTIPVLLEFEGARAGTLWTVQDFGQGAAIDIRVIASTAIGTAMPVVLPGGFPRKGGFVCRANIASSRSLYVGNQERRRFRICRRRQRSASEAGNFSKAQSW